jgi:hypothetical protein
MDSNDPKMSQQGTAGNREHINLTFPHNLEIIWRLESSKS